MATAAVTVKEQTSLNWGAILAVGAVATLAAAVGIYNLPAKSRPLAAGAVTVLGGAALIAVLCSRGGSQGGLKGLDVKGAPPEIGAEQKKWFEENVLPQLAKPKRVEAKEYQLLFQGEGGSGKTSLVSDSASGSISGGVGLTMRDGNCTLCKGPSIEPKQVDLVAYCYDLTVDPKEAAERCRKWHQEHGKSDFASKPVFLVATKCDLGKGWKERIDAFKQCADELELPCTAVSVQADIGREQMFALALSLLPETT